MRKTISPKEAKEKWLIFEKQGKDEKSSFEWQDHLHVPCRNCSDIAGKEVLKPLRAIPNPDVTTADEFWNSCLKQGQDLNCFKCRRDVYLKMFSKGLKKKMPNLRID